MQKKLFIKTLPFNTSSTSGFHELAVILDIDGVIKGAYHYLVKLEDDEVDYELLFEQGLLEDHSFDGYPFYSFQVYQNLLSVLDRYIDTFVPKDKLVLYYWDKGDAQRLKTLFHNNNNKYFHSYFKPRYVDIGGLAADTLEDLYEFSLDHIRDMVDPKNRKLDAMSQLVSIYKFYQSIKLCQKKAP